MVYESLASKPWNWHPAPAPSLSLPQGEFPEKKHLVTVLIFMVWCNATLGIIGHWSAVFKQFYLMIVCFPILHQRYSKQKCEFQGFTLKKGKRNVSHFKSDLPCIITPLWQGIMLHTGFDHGKRNKYPLQIIDDCNFLFKLVGGNVIRIYQILSC